MRDREIRSKCRAYLSQMEKIIKYKRGRISCLNIQIKKKKTFHSKNSKKRFLTILVYLQN